MTVTTPDAIARKPRSKLAKGFLLALGVLVLLVAVGEIVGWPFLRAPLERKLSETFERPVTLGTGFRIRFIGSLRVRADTIAVGPPAPVCRCHRDLHGGALCDLVELVPQEWRSAASALARGG
jgi:hypothetical protein